MITKKILIFGASGQIGRNLIRKLTKSNYKVTAVTRDIHKKGYILKTQAPIGYLEIKQSNIFDYNSLSKLIEENDICINLVGILFEKGKNSFKNIHVDFPDLISKICKKKNIKQMIHISALGLADAKNSKYALSKLQGEKKIRENFEKAVIIKPSLVYSVDDSFTTRFFTLLNLMPIFPLYYKGVTKFTPIHVSDVVNLIFYIISNNILSKDIEAIGPEVLTFKQIIEKLLKSIDKKRLLLPIPLTLAKVSASFFQLFPNPLLTRDQLNLLKYDNVKSDNGISNFDLGCPSKILFEESINSYSFNWMEGGKFSIKKSNQN
tara:strand:+ start:222 stop:1181 length:960 start_codon:yes stop_codon:yes gene_type:complete